ncbi:MAG TPA: redoxin domain-containing protein, partial [Acidimicrobiia bacterium]|nr:redoxin domain-containing protein [Acidimicrobiia bacterium]
LGFPLLSDRSRQVASAFGVKRWGPLPNKRATFVIDTDRRLLDVVVSETNMDAHADQALATLKAHKA